MCQSVSQSVHQRGYCKYRKHAALSSQALSSHANWLVHREYVLLSLGSSWGLQQYENQKSCACTQTSAPFETIQVKCAIYRYGPRGIGDPLVVKTGSLYLGPQVRAGARARGLGLEQAPKSWGPQYDTGLEQFSQEL